MRHGGDGQDEPGGWNVTYCKGFICLNILLDSGLDSESLAIDERWMMKKDNK